MHASNLGIGAAFFERFGVGFFCGGPGADGNQAPKSEIQLDGRFWR